MSPNPIQFDDTVVLSAMMRRFLNAVKSSVNGMGISVDDQQAITYALALTIFQMKTENHEPMSLEQAIEKAREVASRNPGDVDDYLNRNGF